MIAKLHHNVLVYKQSKVEPEVVEDEIKVTVEAIENVTEMAADIKQKAKADASSTVEKTRATVENDIAAFANGPNDEVNPKDRLESDSVVGKEKDKIEKAKTEMGSE